jgi:hypothetical protein
VFRENIAQCPGLQSSQEVPTKYFSKVEKVQKCSEREACH